MPSAGTNKHPIRVEKNLWKAYGEACKAAGTNRSEDIREHMRAKVKEHEQRDHTDAEH